METTNPMMHQKQREAAAADHLDHHPSALLDAPINMLNKKDADVLSLTEK